MNTKFDLYPFLISRNKEQDYQVIVAPAFLIDNELSVLIQATSLEYETEPGIVIHCLVNFEADTKNNFTLIFRVDKATEKDLGENSEKILTDNVGRSIKLIEGVVYYNLITTEDVRITYQDFQKVREYLTQYYRDFWRNQTKGVFRSQSIVFYQDSSSQFLLVKSIPIYNVSEESSIRAPLEQILKRFQFRSSKYGRILLLSGSSIGLMFYLINSVFFSQVKPNFRPDSLSCKSILKTYYKKELQINFSKKDWGINVSGIEKDAHSNKAEINIRLPDVQNSDSSKLKYNFFEIKVIDPDGNIATFSQKVQDVEPSADVKYPQDFKQANSLNKNGIYTIIWEIDQKFLKCHQFQISEV